MVAPSHASGRFLAMFCVHDVPFVSAYTPFSSSGGLLLALFHALRRLTPGSEILIFFQDSSFPSFTACPRSPFLGPATRAIDEYLAASPSSSITAFWAFRTWAWAGKQRWWDTLVEEEFHGSLDDVARITPSHQRVFLEWAMEWVPLGRNDYRRHRRAVADPPQRDLHPFVKGVLGRGSRKLQCAAFQVATGHCFAADYSAAFRDGADDRVDCPDCGQFASHTHVLDTCPGLTALRREVLHNHSSYSIFSCAETGDFLVEFLFRSQRLLRPLDPVPRPIPPEPDPQTR
jgi:hypothetical protein